MFSTGGTAPGSVDSAVTKPVEPADEREFVNLGGLSDIALGIDRVMVTGLTLEIRSDAVAAGVKPRRRKACAAKRIR